jgi:phospholipid transport system substrate-binding protein
LPALLEKRIDLVALRSHSGTPARIGGMDRRFFLTSCVLVACAAFAPRGAAADVDAPDATITTLQQALIAASRGASIDERYRALEPVIVATHDLPYIAEFALRRQWSSLAEADRQRFVAAFQRLSVMTYAARFKAVGADTFRPVAAQPADASGRVTVTTAVARAGQPDVSLEYVLQQDAKGWRIINVIADGVSDLALKRAEYQRLYASGGIDGLIAEIEAQRDRLSQN